MNSVMTMDKAGTKQWRNASGNLHREDGPAFEGADGTREWYFNGKLHRKDGPAGESGKGTKVWCVNGYLHREDGPAYESADRRKEWWVNGKRHREDGPAFECENGDKEWHFNGKKYKKKTYLIKINKLILEKIGSEIANMFGFDQDNAWENSDTFILADFLEEKGDIKTANQIRTLIKFALC